MGFSDSISTSSKRDSSAHTNAERLTFILFSNSSWLRRPRHRRRPHPTSTIHAGTSCGPRPIFRERSVSTSTPSLSIPAIQLGREIPRVVMASPTGAAWRTLSRRSSSNALSVATQAPFVTSHDRLHSLGHLVTWSCNRPIMLLKPRWAEALTPVDSEPASLAWTFALRRTH